MNATTRRTLATAVADRERIFAHHHMLHQRLRQNEGVDLMLGVIVSSTPIPGATNRWEYQMRRAYLNSADQFQDGTASEPWYIGTALNILEGGNTGTLVCPGVLTANIPTGFTVKPICNQSFHYFRGHRNNDGTFRWLFSCVNAIDGTCPE